MGMPAFTGLCVDVTYCPHDSGPGFKPSQSQSLTYCDYLFRIIKRSEVREKKIVMAYSSYHSLNYTLHLKSWRQLSPLVRSMAPEHVNLSEWGLTQSSTVDNWSFRTKGFIDIFVLISCLCPSHGHCY